MMRSIRELLSPEQIQELGNAPLTQGTRHPTWFPLFCKTPRAIDYLVNQSICRISKESGGEGWLRSKVPQLMNFETINNASSALAEIRAYGGFLEAGFQVFPIPESDDSTPDFEVDAGDGRITVEVATKHQDKQMDELQEAIHSVDPLPESVHRHTSELTNVKITTTIASITPGGKPDPHKPNDSIQANMVSRICAIKQDEHQIPGHKPAILVMDFANFGGPHIAEMSDTCAASPVQSFRGDITCGHFWYALYGYKGAPLFEAGHRPLVHMQHDGRYRLKCKQKSKLSAVLLVMPKASILLENPWPKRRLPERARILLIQYPWFDLTRSIGDWKKGNAAMQIKLHRKLISAMEKHCPEFWEP